LILSDFDPDGEEICNSFVRGLRDDFGLNDIIAVKVALTSEQVKSFKLPPVMTAKETSAQCTKFVDKFGTDVFELDALAPADLQRLLRDAIHEVLDLEAFNAEVAEEHKDAQYLAAMRKSVSIPIDEASRSAGFKTSLKTDDSEPNSTDP